MRVVVNAAMSADGKIALRGGNPLKLSDAPDFARVHEMRANVDAILVGIGTVLADDPRLLSKHPGTTRHPTRVILDSRGRTPPTARVLDGAAPTLVFVADGYATQMERAEVVTAGHDRVDLRLMLRELQARGIRTLMVEGGATVIASFLRARLVDDFYLYIAPKIVGGGAPTLVEGAGAEREDDVLSLQLAGATMQGEGVLLHYRQR